MGISLYNYRPLSQIICWTYIYQHEKFEKKKLYWKWNYGKLFFLTKVEKQIFEGSSLRLVVVSQEFLVLLSYRVVESEDFLGFRLRLQQFWKTDSDSNSFKKPTPTPAFLKIRLRLQQFKKNDSDSSWKHATPPTPTPQP